MYKMAEPSNITGEQLQYLRVCRLVWGDVGKTRNSRFDQSCVAVYISALKNRRDSIKTLGRFALAYLLPAHKQHICMHTITQIV